MNNHIYHHPTITFPALRNIELAKHGKYRTQRHVLEAWNRLNI